MPLPGRPGQGNFSDEFQRALYAWRKKYVSEIGKGDTVRGYPAVEARTGAGARMKAHPSWNDAIGLLPINRVSIALSGIAA